MSESNLDVKEVNLDWNEVEKTKYLMKTEGTFVYFNMHQEASEEMKQMNGAV